MIVSMTIWTVLSLVLAIASTARPGEVGGCVTFTGAADASAIAVIDSNLIAVADDEDDTLRIYAVTGGRPIASLNVADFLQVDRGKPEADIEAACRAGDRIYWIGSHGRNKDGKPRPSRCRLFATDIRSDPNGRSLKPAGQPCKTLLAGLLASKELKGLGLEEAAGVDQLKVTGKKKDARRLAPKEEGLNIEALAASPDGKRLLVGFRNPIPRGKALVVPLENPAAMIDRGEPPVVGRPLLWDLGGRGIRDMGYVAELGVYFIIAGPYDEEKRFALYRWSGDADQPPTLFKPDLGKGYPHFTPEAIAGFGRERRLLILSDDGTRPVEVTGPQECRPDGLLPDGKCLNKSLLNPDRKTFRGLWISVP
jgi:hypothetical protein